MDQGTLRGREGQRGGRAHGNLADEVEIRGQGLARAEGIRGADSVAVHGGAREFGERVRGEDVAGSDAAEGEGRVDRNGVRQRSREMREQEGAGFVGREESQEFGHRSVEGCRLNVEC